MTDPSGSQREYYVCRLELAAQRDAAMKARHVGVVGGGLLPSIQQDSGGRMLTTRSNTILPRKSIRNNFLQNVSFTTPHHLDQITVFANDPP